MVDAPLRILSIAHTAVSRAAGRLRYHPFANDPALDVQLVVPTRWYQFGRWLDADPADDQGAKVIPLPIRLPRAGPASWYLHHYPALGGVVSSFSPDVIHLWEEPWSVVALQASLLARRCGAALVLEVDQNIMKRLPPPFEWIRRHVLRHTDLILPRSADATAVARASGYVGPTSPIAYGVDQSVFRPGEPLRAAPPFELGYVGRLVEEKGLDDVLDAMAQCPEKIRLSIVGEGPHEAALRQHATTAGLADRVSFQPWSDPKTVTAFIQGRHAIVLPTRTTGAVKEQFGRVIIEAQACGIPVIGSTCGAIPDVLGRGGWIVPESDPAALSTLLERLAGDPDEVASCGLAGRANVATRFTYDAIARDLARAWRQAAALRDTHRAKYAEVAASANPVAGAERV